MILQDQYLETNLRGDGAKLLQSEFKRSDSKSTISRAPTEIQEEI
jgi:hypothetical protein